jgi:ribonuclease P protein component
MPYSFACRHRVKKGTEIRAILESGESLSCKGMRLAWKGNELGYPRMAIALKRGYGRAVDRNRAKRLVRESFRLLKPSLTRSFDAVFQVFPGVDRFQERDGQMRRLLSRAGMLPHSSGIPGSGGLPRARP